MRRCVCVCAWESAGEYVRVCVVACVCFHCVTHACPEAGVEFMAGQGGKTCLREMAS